LRNLPIRFLVVLLCLATPAVAQDHEHHHAAAESPADVWTWTTDANVFFGYNYQQRKFADASAWESQNWFMLDGSRKAGRGRLTLDAMLSLEPWTIGRATFVGTPPQRVNLGGSPQLFQTGESYILTTNGVDERIPLVNVQHPHDLFMGLGGTYRADVGAVAYTVGADLVGAATLGPTPFMHRESARSNPQAPLTHHYMDSTHISAGVVRAGVDIHGVTFEASTFRGEEPDEHRTDIERPKLDSWAVRGGWHHGSWQAQVSGGRLHEPEWFDPFDVTRITASIAYNGAIGSRPLAVTAGWGENRMFNGFQNIEDGYLLEWDLKASRMSTVYGRAEQAAKHLFGLAPEPPGFAHKHALSDVGALTLGSVFDPPLLHKTRLGIGGDVTLYRTSQDLDQFYGGSHSYHVFLRWRPAPPRSPHVH
jgi:hypothetical protein